MSSDPLRPFPTRSTSLNRGQQREHEHEHESADHAQAHYPPMREQYSSTDSDPLTADHSPRLAQGQGTPRAEGRGVLPYTSNSPPLDGHQNAAFGDHPYYGGRGSLDLADAYGGTEGIPLEKQSSRGTTRKDSVDTDMSRVPLYTPVPMPLHAGASIQMAQDPNRGRASTPEHRYGKGEKSRTHSRESSRTREGLGNWQGPAQGRSPYGPLGQGPGVGSPLGGQSGANTPTTSNPNLLFADGDFVKPPSNAFSRFVFAVFDSSFIVRWIVYIIPLLAILWIPGILGLTAYPNAKVWNIPLVWWSAWLSVAWCGWWGAALVARMAPTVLRNTLGVVAPELRHYILYVASIQFYIGAAGWALANYASFGPLVQRRAADPASESAAKTVSLLLKGLFGIFLVLVILLVEKLTIQVIAHNFHKKSYEDRIDDQKFQIKVLTALYLNSRDTGHRDTLDGSNIRPKNRRQVSDPSLLVKKALQGVKKVAQSTTTVIGTVASEIAGERVLQPNSPASMVMNALGSTNKTKQLARRIYYSFVPSYRQALLLEDVSRCFQNRDIADRAFGIFDRDGNGDISLEELEMACLEIHRERLALTNSMRDIDSAVGRLDSIIMSLWYVVSVIIIVGLLDASFQTMIAGAGTVILGLSWLIGTTAQEILASIIFLFVKHVYDVGDRVDIDGASYVVKEMHLLSTIFRRIDGVIVQAPHSILNTKFVNNIRRSGAISETFTWEVDFETPFEKIEELRARMLEFLEIERRDFMPQIDIAVKDFEGQGKLSLSADIKYKSNWQNGALKAQRRNKWCCALKLAMASLQIFGPAGAGNPAPPPADPVEYTLVPYEEVERLKKKDDVDSKADVLVTKADVLSSGEDSRLAGNRAVEQEEAGDFFTGPQSGVARRAQTHGMNLS